MACVPSALSSVLALSLVSALIPGPALGRGLRTQAQQADKQKKEKKEKKRARRAEEADPSDGARPTEEEVVVVADSQSAVGDLYIAEGYVNVTLAELRLQADRVTYNRATGDMVAEGNVIFDQGADQRVTARRAEINWYSRRGVFWDTTGFTNRTQTGDYIFFTAERIEKTGPETYELFGARVTACEDAVPKWQFATKHADLKVNDRLKLSGAVLKIKKVPAFVLPYAWIPATRTERKSGFLIPTSGSSNAKGRTFKVAYYQTLGQSADITFRHDLYAGRGIGVGAEFRAQTDENSYMRLGTFSVKDRLFGPPGEDQGGTAFVAEGVQYLPYGWLAVGNVSFVSSLKFRQVFSDDISQVVDPRRESSFYANNNAGNFSFNLLASNETTRIFNPPTEPGSQLGGTDFDIKIRQAPQVDLVVYPRRMLGSLPVYFSFDASLGALKREEAVEDTVVLVTPAAVQRLDFQPKFTAPLATFAGIAVTPSLALRQTFYTSSIDPQVPVFDPNRFAVGGADPRLDPSKPQFKPGLKVFDRNVFDPILPVDLSRRYAEFTLDIRPPALGRQFLNPDGSGRFKHLIEPYVAYRLIRGIGDEFDNIIRFDERDAVANTNEFEYAIVNRFFVNRRASEAGGKRKKAERERERGRDGPKGQTPPVEPGELAPTERKETKPRLESGRQAELGERPDVGRQQIARPGQTLEADEDDQEVAPTQAYELLSVKVAQKYFIDRDFGGALVEGRRNQFYPINALSGFTFGGRARTFSPVNLQVRYRPLSSMYADARVDLGNDDGVVRNLTLSAGLATDALTVRSSWYLSRRLTVDSNSFEAGTFPGNQLVTTFQYGDESKGWYGGSRISYEFTDRFISEGQVSTGRLRHSRSFVGYGWDCCGVQFNYNTFKAGLRNESALSFTFTLAGIGSFGSDQFSQLGGGRGARKRGKKLRRDRYDEY